VQTAHVIATMLGFGGGAHGMTEQRETKQGEAGQEETPLAGGLVTEVVRVGATVRRRTGPWSPAVHALLAHLEAVGYAGAPRFLGIDEAGREILSFIEGVVPHGAHPDVVTDLALRDVGELIRGLHAATAGFALPPGLAWYVDSLGGPEPHVVCHHDLSPKNTVFRAGRAVAFIDWDLATPEAPVHDVVHAAWQFVPLTTDQACARQGWARPPDRGRRLRILLDAHGLPRADRRDFAARVAGRMETTAAGIEALAAGGAPAFRRLVARGVPDDIRRDREWVRAHAGALDSAIRR
jgi:hypothetical protein